MRIGQGSPESSKKIAKTHTARAAGTLGIGSYVGQGDEAMVWVVVALVLAILSVMVLAIKHRRDQEQLEMHSITAEGLHALLATGQTVRLFDVRQPLDLLAHLEIIPTAQRIVPDHLIANPSLIPKDKDVIVYCTCPGEKTSREILRRALAMGYSRVKFLCGGLAAWKAKGYSVEPYQEVFHLQDPKLAQHSG